MMETVGPSETSVFIYQIKQPRISEDNNLPCPTCFIFPFYSSCRSLILSLERCRWL